MRPEIKTLVELLARAAARQALRAVAKTAEAGEDASNATGVSDPFCENERDHPRTSCAALVSERKG
jgi:hypothetical protein